ncbi:ABC transporter permease [Weissella halotolerans]|uniref:ABC transporter EcsB n=1 Tax=Weissella halotolerans DSM 20190 TaxID=1123500 RepID=A0A0R2FYN5_9LACO|nr:ABC transporter permease [Weissella halotolerans]KRN33561.1 ABC transporter EcsB [Weissella halotolerans DSM 20190]
MKGSKLFKQRWQRQWQTYAKYLPYVFNDHAILAFVILFGAALLAYRQFLLTLTVTPLTLLLLWLGMGLTLTIFNRPATFILEADTIFFLGDQTSLVGLYHYATLYSMIINGFIELVLLLALLPLMIVLLTTKVWLLVLLICLMVTCKVMCTGWLAYRWAHFSNDYGAVSNKLVNWRQLAQAETNRQARILAFFNLFIDVPGQTAKLSRRRWATPLIRHWPGQQTARLTYLYVLTFFRQDQYFMTWMRLTLFGLAVVVLSQGWLRVCLLALLVYLLMLQLIPLVTSHRQIVFDHLMPLSLADRKAAFVWVISPLLVVTQVLWLGLALVLAPKGQELLQMGLPLVLMTLVLVFWYSGKEIETLFKRRAYRAFKK